MAAILKTYISISIDTGTRVIMGTDISISHGTGTRVIIGIDISISHGTGTVIIGIDISISHGTGTRIGIGVKPIDISILFRLTDILDCRIKCFVDKHYSRV